MTEPISITTQTDHHCDEGWICEQHPDQPWPHGYEWGNPNDFGCAGPGMPCQFENCEHWPQRWPLMDGSGRNWVVNR